MNLWKFLRAISAPFLQVSFTGVDNDEKTVSFRRNYGLIAKLKGLVFFVVMYFGRYQKWLFIFLNLWIRPDRDNF